MSKSKYKLVKKALSPKEGLSYINKEIAQLQDQVDYAKAEVAVASEKELPYLREKLNKLETLLENKLRKPIPKEIEIYTPIDHV